MKKSLLFRGGSLLLLPLALCLFGCPNTTETPPAVSLTELKMAADTITLKCGAGETLALRAIPAEASLEGVVWSSGDETVLTVSGGKITTLKTGTAEVKAVSADGAVSAACTVTVTPAALILFSTEGKFTGNLGGRDGADFKVRSDGKCPADVTDIHAFLSVSEADEIRNMPGTYGFDPSLPILGPDRYTVIADNWADLLDGTIKQDLVASGVFPPFSIGSRLWWSGSANDGRLGPDDTYTGPPLGPGEDNCGGWTSTAQLGMVGSMARWEDSSKWIYVTNYYGDAEWYLLGIGASRLPRITEARPPAALVLAPVTCTGGESFTLTASFTPADALPAPREVNWLVADPSLLSPPSGAGLSATFQAADRSGTTTVTASTPDGSLSVECTVTVAPSHLRLFGSAAKTGGAFGGRGGAEEILGADANRPVAPVAFENCRAFLSVSPEDCIAVMPETFGFSPDLPVYSGDGTVLLADNWADLLDGPKESLMAAKVFTSEYITENIWWSGSTQGGSSAMDCADWTVNYGNGIVGAPERADGVWLAGAQGYGGSGHRLLGLVW